MRKNEKIIILIVTILLGIIIAILVISIKSNTASENQKIQKATTITM